jgi:NADPH:quinone reductase-like Zn-dependent oxidoreductase
MKALIFRKTGEPKSTLELAEMPVPPLGPGEVLVRVLLSPINASDLHMVRGRYGYQPELPASPGIEGVGIVEAVGPGVQGPIPGTRVVFIDTWSTWREQIVCPADKLVPVPDGLDDSPAAASYINPLTAWALTRSTHGGACVGSDALHNLYGMSGSQNNGVELNLSESLDRPVYSI